MPGGHKIIKKNYFYYINQKWKFMYIFFYYEEINL